MLSTSKVDQKFLTSGSTLELPSMTTQATSFCNNYEQDSISGLRLQRCLSKSSSKNYKSSNSLFRENNLTEYFDTTEYLPFKDDAKTEYFDPIGFSIQEDIVDQDVKPTEVQIKPTEVHIQPATEVQIKPATKAQVKLAGVYIKPVDLIDHVHLAEEHVDLAEEHVDLAEEHVHLAEEHVDLAEEHVDLPEEHVDLADMIEHFELAQGSRGSLPEAELDRHGRVIELHSAQPYEFDRSKFIKLSTEIFFDLTGSQLKLLSDLCRAVHRAQEFFLSVGTNQWVRTSIASNRPSQDLFSPTSIVEERSKLISSVTFHSVVLPHDPFWTRAQAVGNGANKLRVHFPCTLLKEALQQGTTLMEKLLEWREKREECEIGQHGMKRSADGNSIEDPLRLFWEIQADHVKPLKQFEAGSYGTIWLVTWRGGIFVRKDRISTSNHVDDADPRDAVDTELNVVEKLSHPHIVYSFGVSYAENKSSLYMEYMQNDLYHCIADRVRTTGDNEPPFSHQDSVNILLQFAKAMAYTHTQNVVHGDLKSRNILVSEVFITEGENHYVIKVADFGSAQVVSPDFGSTGFLPGPATTSYAAPEVLELRNDKNVVISFPEKIDVYSFGIVAFEVITGEEPYMDVRPTKVKKGVIDGSLRPPLRAECQKENFLHEERLISLIERCWCGDPSERPPFSEVVEVLNCIRSQILV